MKYNGITRRMFLQGTGHLLFTIPFLESLVPKALAQASSSDPIVRYMQLISPFGIAPGDYYATLSGTTNIANNIVPNGNPVRVTDLMSYDLPSFSYAIGPELTALRSKFSILRGLDLSVLPTTVLFHNMIYPTSASPGQPISNPDYVAPPLSNQATVDVVIANALNTYPASFPRDRRLIVFGPANKDTYFNTRSFSWERQPDGTLKPIPPINETASLLNIFVSEFTKLSQEPTPDPSGNKSSNLMSAIYEDYKRVRDSSKISRDDKLKLESYMSLISDIHRGFSSGSESALYDSPSCKDPSSSINQSAELTPDEKFKQQFRIVAAAFACGMTRVASSILVFDKLGSHEGHHSQYGPEFVSNFTRFSKHVAFLMNELEQIPDQGTNLLDNSILYWTSEFGLRSYWGQHVREDYPVLVAGGGGGKLQQGKFIDFRLPNGSSTFWNKDDKKVPGVTLPSMPLRGIPINNLLITFMKCMGLTPTDYETIAGQGYGYYPSEPEGNALPTRLPDSTFWHSTAGRRSPLPYFYKG